MKNKTKKYYFDALYLELTRRCNLRCAHCMCGEPQDVTITPEIIDQFLPQVTAIKRLTLGGGEPLIELDMFEYLIDALERYDVPVFLISVVHNATVRDERVMKIIDKFLARNPLSHFSLAISNDVFHDQAQSKTCLEFYEKLAGERCDVHLHEDIDWLHHAGRAWGKRSIMGIPVIGSNDTAFRPHRIKIIKEHVSCWMYLAANGNLCLQCDTSFNEHDRLALGNVSSESLQSIFNKNYKECPYLCDECFSEAAIRNYEDFFCKPTSIEDNLVLFRSRIEVKHLELTWALREWAFKSLPQVDPRGIIQGTIVDKATFCEYILSFLSRSYCAMSSNPEIKKLYNSDELAQAHFLQVAANEHVDRLKKKFPTAKPEALEELSMLQAILGALNQMTVDDYMLALFGQNSAEDYFKTIAQRLKKHGMSIRNFDPCAKIPDTLDKEEEVSKDDDKQTNELQPNTDS